MSGVREITVIWALSIGFSKTGTEMWLNFTPDEVRDEHTCFTGTRVRQMFVLLKIPPGFIKSYGKFTDPFQNKLKSLRTKIIFDPGNK